MAYYLVVNFKDSDHAKVFYDSEDSVPGGVKFLDTNSNEITVGYCDRLCRYPYPDKIYHIDECEHFKNDVDHWYDVSGNKSFRQWWGIKKVKIIKTDDQDVRISPIKKHVRFAE